MEAVKLKFIITLFTALLISSYFHLPILAASKSFYFPSVFINIKVNPDASINWTEERTFSFSGDFSRVYWDIPLNKGQTISDVSLSDNRQQVYQQLPAPDTSRPEGNFAVSQIDQKEHIEAYGRFTTEKRKIILKFRL